MKYFLTLCAATSIVTFIGALLAYLHNSNRNQRNNPSSPLKQQWRINLFIIATFACWLTVTLFGLALLTVGLNHWKGIYLMEIVSNHFILYLLIIFLPSIFSGITLLLFRGQYWVVSHANNLNKLNTSKIVFSLGNWHIVKLGQEVTVKADILDKDIKDQLATAGLDDLELSFSVANASIPGIYENDINYLYLPQRKVVDYREVLKDVFKASFVHALLQYKDEVAALNLNTNQAPLVSKIFASMKEKLKIPLQIESLSLSLTTVNGHHIITVPENEIEELNKKKE